MEPLFAAMELFDIDGLDMSHLLKHPLARTKNELKLPANKLLLVNAWIELHREEIVASWNAGKLTGEFMKVEALR